MEILDYGVCRLSMVPVRKKAGDTQEMVTQLLFGDDYEVIQHSEDGRWFKIRIRFDQYEGWIDAKQHHAISKEYFEYIHHAEFKITTDITSSLLYNKTPLPVVIGSMIPISGAELFRMEEQFAFNGESKSVGQKREFDFLQRIAIKYVNAPYLWGGKSPFGLDCSGFVQVVFKICGYRLNRDAWQQSSQGRPVSSFQERQAGDVAFFANSEGKITHTGIIIGEGRIIHASGKVRIDQLDEVGILNAETRLYSHQLAHLRRILA